MLQGLMKKRFKIMIGHRFTTILTAILLAFLTGCGSSRNRVHIKQENVRVGDSIIHVNCDATVVLPTPVVIAWVNRAAIAVTGYLGRFPVKDLQLNIYGDGDEAVGDGITYGNRRIDVHLGNNVEVSDLNDDWILTHEMFHLAFPTLPRRYSWMMEGLSDYLEPVARARAGQLTVPAVWKEFVEGLPEGLPAEGDQGLDNTFTRERIYWGGDLYWLLADVQIRVKTGNRHSVDDVIRTILNQGGDGGADWSLEQVLKRGDEITGTSVLTDLHNELGLKPGMTDLNELWKKLGVEDTDGVIHFDDTAPWAFARKAITAGN
jgi:hypothetical protein